MAFRVFRAFGAFRVFGAATARRACRVEDLGFEVRASTASEQDML